MAGWIKMPLRMEVGFGPGDFVLDGDPAPPQKVAEPTIFGPCLLGPNDWMDEGGTWYGGRPPLKRNCVKWEPSSPSPKRGQSPQFAAPVYCGQTAEWIKMPFRTVVGLGPGHIVLNGDPAPAPQKGYSPAILSPCLL